MTDPPPAPYSFRGGLLWSFRELGKFSMPIRPAKPNPKNMPEATSFRTSGTCSASTRGLVRTIRRNVAPISAATKPVTRLGFLSCTLLRPASRPRIIVTGKPGSFHPSLLVQVECDRRGKPDRVNVSAVPHREVAHPPHPRPKHRDTAPSKRCRGLSVLRACDGSPTTMCGM